MHYPSIGVYFSISATLTNKVNNMTDSDEPNNGLTTEFFNSFVSSTVKTYNQGKASINAKGNCVYRGTDRACCIIGHSIADEHYDRYMDEEALNCGDFNIVDALEESAGASMNCHDERMAELLQKEHDNLSKFIDRFKERLLSRLEEGEISKEYPEFVSAVKVLIDKGA